MPGDARQPANAAIAGLHGLPDGFSIAADGGHDADAGDHDPVVGRKRGAHCGTVRGVGGRAAPG